MGVRLVAAGLLVAIAVSGAAAGAGGIAATVRYLEARQQVSGGFAERNRDAAPDLTAWVVLALRAAGAKPPRAAGDYLAAHENALTTATDLALAALAKSALGADPNTLLARLRAQERASGAIGPAVNSTVWSIIALRQAGQTVPPKTVRYVLSQQARSGGWSWNPGGAPDSNDTAAAVEALTAAGVRGKPIRRALRYLRRLENRDGGFALVAGRASDAQSTAWAIQAFLGARVSPPRAAFAFLARLRRPDGSYRYSARYATSPTWVTAQVLPAVARRAFPLR